MFEKAQNLISTTVPKDHIQICDVTVKEGTEGNISVSSTVYKDGENKLIVLTVLPESHTEEFYIRCVWICGNELMFCPTMYSHQTHHPEDPIVELEGYTIRDIIALSKEYIRR